MAETLLFELATEEIPAAYQKNLWLDWEKRLPQLLATTGLGHGKVSVFASARRIAFSVEAIQERAEDTTETLQGPAKNVALTADGKPTPALVGFAKKAGIEPTQVTFTESPKGAYATATVVRKGKTLREALPGLLHDLCGNYRFPRSMRWADQGNVYARPIAGYFLLYGDKHWQLDEAELKGTVLESIPFRSVRGHFILDTAPLQVPTASAYASTLHGHGIVADPRVRRAGIAQLLTEAASAEGLSLIANDSLLDEVNFLVERPSIVVGSFSEDYLRLPDGVILSEMNQHQRYFGLRDKQGKLSNRFLIVANADTKNPAAVQNIRSGNERVLRARLSDGAFFYDEDLKRSLADRVDDLKQIVFHEGLGTYLEKVRRIGELAAIFGGDKAELKQLTEAARLIKADLTTQLVYEFDHLQGEIGAVYAARNGVNPETCTAIHEHYLPRFQGDALPSTRLGTLLSLADKWDNTVAAFLLGKEPTASQDPFAIRRQSLYIIQMLVAQKIRLSLSDLLKESIRIYAADYKGKADAEQLREKIVQFFKARLVTIFEGEGFDKRLTRAAVFSGSDDAYDLFTRAAALRDIAEKDRSSFDALLAAFKRMANIIKEVKNAGPVNTGLLSQTEELALHAFAQKLHGMADEAVSDPLVHYRAIFSEFAAGKPIVDAFFDKVMVNHEDQAIKANRQNLIAYTLAAVTQLIDLEQLS
ncbi:MAG TPA: glycine--tRNA ligase subunit beta [Turneriella sp.]|nr:glycine--tRNA ligase subunit beta [Turneriella sp.]